MDGKHQDKTKQQQTWWQRNRYRVGVFVVVGLIVLALMIYELGWSWTGLDGGYNTVTTTIVTPRATPPITVTTQRPPAKTLWDWLQLLGVFAIPFAVVWFTAWQNHDRQIAADNQQETALQTYLSNISDFLTNNAGSNKEQADRSRVVVKARTLTLLPSLDKNRKRVLLQFLHELELINDKGPTIELMYANISGADLRGIDIQRVNLSFSNLSAANLEGADLRKANLVGTNLSGTNLREANLIDAQIIRANLSRANLSMNKLSNINLFKANLSEANLVGADLTDAILVSVNLHKADLSKADLTGANLNKADLRKAKITQEQLSKTKSLQGTIMPDGSIHP